MKIVRLIFKIIIMTIVLIASYPFVIILTPIVIIFWGRLSGKIKKSAFTIFNHFEPHNQDDFKETVVEDEIIHEESHAREA